MNNIILRDPFRVMDDAFANMDNWWLHLFNQPSSTLKKLGDTGISVIGRPHNVIAIKSKDGKTIGNKIEVVTTPFRKDEVSVEFSKGMLTVKCQKLEKTVPEEELDEAEVAVKEYEVHHGISSQEFTFSLKISDKVDVENIKAKNEDGILTIELPFVKEEEKPDDIKKITVL